MFGTRKDFAGRVGLGMLPRMASSKLVRTERALFLFAETLFSDHSGPPARQRVESLARDAVALLVATTPRARLMFSVCLFVVLWVAPLFIRRAPGLARLPLPLRVAALEKMEHTAAGAALVLAVKAVLCILWYEQPESVAGIGVDPPCQPGVRRSLPVLSGGVA